MKLNNLRDEIHKNAVEKGFHEQIDVLKKMQESGQFTATEIEAVSSAFLGQKLMLVVSELGESIEAHRTRERADVEKYKRLKVYESDMNLSVVFENYIKDTYEDEIADVIIRLLDVCGAYNIDIDFHIKEKMRYNSNRPKKHGKEY